MSDVEDRIAGLSPAKRALLDRLRVSAVRAPEDGGAIPRRGPGPAPLSWEQRRLWFLHRLAPGTPAYTVPVAFRLAGPLDERAMRRAIRRVAERHEALRLAFREADGEPVQEAGPADRISIEVHDLRAAPDASDANLLRFFTRGFDLAREPPSRALLLRTAGDEHLLALAMHHVAADGASSAILLRELSVLYAAEAEGWEAGLPAPGLQLPDFAAWQRARGVDEREVEWWRTHLAGAPHVLEVPPDRPRPAAQSFAGSRVSFAPPAGLAERVRALAPAEQASVFSVLLAAFAVVLHRATGEEELLVGTAVGNRPAAGADAVGFFANTLPLRVRVDPECTVRELVARARQAVAAAQDHASVPFDRIVDAAGVQRDASRSPLVQAVVSLDPAEEDALALPGIRAERIAVDTGASPFDLTLQLADGRGGIRGEILYRTDLYDPATIARLADRLGAALAAFADDPRALLVEIPLVAAEERRTLLAWGHGGAARTDGCIHHLFEARARAAPDALAVAWADQEVSYAALNRRANRIAHLLVARGIGMEARVGVLMERTPALLAAILGVLKAGAAYVPLDPRNPPARLAAMVRTPPCRALLVDRRHAGVLAETGVPEVAVEAIRATPRTAHDPQVPADPAALAYVVFTSGSTGEPKGVEVCHGSAFAFLHVLRDLLSPGDLEHVLAAGSIGFDVSIPELFGPLSWGGAVVLVENALSPPPAARPVRTAVFVPATVSELIAADRLPPGIRTLVAGGEPLTPALAGEIHGRTATGRLVNIYGPTEATVYATFEEVKRGADRIGIGSPVPGARAYVLDGGMRMRGTGEPGELWLAGSVLARGYAGRPGLTAERFVPDPFGPPGARMYRTFDRARFRHDGTLEYLGRADDQVKVRGVRIEPGEVEAALRAHPAVREAAVAAHGAGERRALAAYLVPEPETALPAPAVLRAFLRERLPEAMVPASYAAVDALPRTTTGKLDRRALPAPPTAAADDARAPVAPRTPEEARIAEVWREVLRAPGAGVHDDFFESGGNSLLALRLLARIRETLGVELSVATLLQGPTVAQVTRAIADSAVPPVRLPVVALQPHGPARPLFLVHAGGGHVACYAPLAALLAPDQPVYAFQARGLDDGLEPLQGVEAMAAHYLEGLRRTQARGPYRLGGWSYGGIVAFEMARQLRLADEVELLALLDTARPESRDDVRMALDHASVLRRILTDLFGWSGTAVVTIEGLRGRPPEEQLRHAARKLGPRLLPPERLPEVAALTRVRMANHNALVDYAAQPFPGRITYFRTRGSAGMVSSQEAMRFWGRLAEGGFGVHEVGGNHGTLLQAPHVETVATALRAVLRVLDG